VDAYHDARFTDYLRDAGGGTLEQLRGNQLELSPHNLAALGIVYDQPHGIIASLVAHYVDSRFLNKRNTAPASDCATLDLGIGYHLDPWTLRLDLTNITDRRDPVTESELGDASLYRLQGFGALFSFRYDFR
jgi:outer membrane receptor protein involved in Fe transport